VDWQSKDADERVWQLTDEEGATWQEITGVDSGMFLTLIDAAETTGECTVGGSKAVNLIGEDLVVIRVPAVRWLDPPNGSSSSSTWEAFDIFTGDRRGDLDDVIADGREEELLDT